MTSPRGVGATTDAATGLLRIAAVADADSFVKWAAALMASVPTADARLAIVETPLTVSAAQQRAALAGTGLDDGAVVRIAFDGVRSWLRETQPDVLVVAGRGPFARLVMRVVDDVQPRPVTVMGLPGMAIPAQRGAAQYRRESDLLVVHSHREQRAFGELSDRLGLDLRLGLATLPYARPVAPASGGTDLVFAAQALVPHERADRERMAAILRAAAEADPSRRVVVKLRSRRELGEAETHLERAGYPELIGAAPSNLVVSHEPMAEALAHAEGLVTVSSTAAVEAIALGVPVIALDTFGVGKTTLNGVFADSGLLGDEEDVIARRFRHPSPEWMSDNYFHAADDDTWWARAADLVERRRRGDLPPRAVPAPRGGALHAAWHRRSVLGAHDRTLSGAVALAIGTPLVSSVLAVRRLRGRSGPGAWSDDASDITLAPSPHRDSIRRSTRAA